MGVKYFCDICGKEIKEMVTEVTIDNYLRINKYFLCSDCAEKVEKFIEKISVS